METAQRRQTISKLSRIPGYSGGGFLDGLKRAVGLAPAETMREKFAREDAERAAKNPPKQDPAPAPAPATGVYAGRDGAGGNSMTRREKEAGLAKGGKLKPSMAKAAMQTYASGGLTGAIEKKVSDYISGTPAYARGGTMGKRSFADGGWSALVDHGPSIGLNTLLARGGEIKPGMGSKLKGPGTSTSDDIPAEVVDTGEPIKVATGERIVSKKQDQFLQTVAKERGFKSVDAMFEDATGIPVGPTLKYDNDGDEKTAQRGANDGDGDEPIKHAGLGAMLDSAKRAVGLAPAETMREKFAREDAERAAKNPPKPAPAPEQATAPVTNISGYAGNSSLAAREKAAGLARGGEVSRNMARQRLAKLPSGPKKKEVRVSAKPMVQKRVDRSTEQEVEEGADEFDVQTQIANSVGNAPEGSDVRTVYRAAPGYAGYSSGGLTGAIEKQVSSYINGTPAYAAGGEVRDAKKKAELEAAFALGAQAASPVSQIPTGGVPGAGPTQSRPDVQDPGAFDTTRSFAREAMRDVGEQYNKGNVSGAVGRAVRGYAATNVAGLVDAANAVGSVLRPVGNLVSNLATGEDMSPAQPEPAKPVTQPVTAAPAGQTPYQPSKVAYGDGLPATTPSAPGSPARLNGTDGKDVGNGVTRLNVPGKSPLFTNMTDAAGMADNERLISRDPDGIANMDNQRAMQGIQDRQDAADAARARMAQYNAEVAGAQAINSAPPAFDPEAGARLINDRNSQTNRAIQNLSSRDRMGRLAPGAERLIAEIYKQALGGYQTDRIEGQRNATTQRGQDLAAQAAGAQTQLQRQRFGLEANQDQRAAKQAARAERAQQRIESLYDDYANADPKDKPALAEQLRVMTGKDKPEQWQAIALQGSTDAMGNKTEGVLAAVNKSTGEMRKIDQGGAASNTLPPGMVKQVGTSGGKPVYEDAKGNRHY